MSVRARRALDPRELQLRLRGDHPRAPHAAEHADPLRRRGARARRGARVGVDKLELIALLLAIAFVLIAEMINTAIEGAVDVATTSFDPMAKLAKDIAAGAVLIATVERRRGRLPRLLRPGRRPQLARCSTGSSNAPAELTLIALVLTTILVIATKALTGRGTPLRGGLPVGPRGGRVRRLDGGDARSSTTPHRFLVSSLTFIMALLVAQTRVESGVHSSLEVVYGGAARRARRPSPSSS